MVVEFLLLTLLPYTLLAFAWVMFIDYFLVLPFTMRRTKGVVVDYASNTDSHGETLYAARFTYIANGAEHETVNDMWHRRKQPDIGATVPIEYIQGNEKHAHFVSRYRKLYVIGFLGLALYAIYAVTLQQGISNIGVLIFAGISLLLIFWSVAQT